MPRHLASLVGFACALACGAALAEPYVEHLDPPSVARGKRNRIVVVGSEVDRVVGLWTTLPADKLKLVSATCPSRDRSLLEIEVAADCPLGMCGLRLATEDGLSNLCLIQIDELTPQEKLADPQTEFPVAVAGELRTAGVESYRIQASAGQKLTFDVLASRFGTDADPLVTIIDSAGRKVARQDNEPGLFFDCRLAHTFEQTGIYTIEVRDARFQGSPHWRYVLRIGSFPPPEAKSDEKEPNDTPEQATAMGTAPLVLHGIIDKSGDKDQFTLDLAAGQKLTLRAETKGIGSAADVELAIFDPTGREMQRNDDVTLPGNLLDEATLNITAGKAGLYRLQVREMTELGGPQFGYRVTISEVGPRIQLSSEISDLTLPQASYIRLPVTAVRTDYGGPIELSLVGAPPGIMLEPSVIPEGATSLDCRLVATANAPQGVFTLTIAGRGQAGEKELAAAVTVQPLVDRQLINVDLIKYALRDNQRWLPASVTDRIALQVTPSAPFAIELPESLVTLPRYQQATLPISITRTGGFEGPISFSASGGQVGEESQGRRQVYCRFPKATAGQALVTATIHSRSLAQENKERIDILATAQHGTRAISLVRSFTLDTRPAFALALEPMTATLAPGMATKVKLAFTRLPTFAGPLSLNLTGNANVTVPESLEIAPGQTSAEVELIVPADAKPGKQRVRFVAQGQVGAFQEETKPIDFDLEIKLEKKP